MIFQFRIQLQDISKPPVWRAVQVPGDFTFHRFHLVIQAAFGWQDIHLYQFAEKGYRSDLSISIPSGDDYFPVEDSRKIKLSDIFHTKGQQYTYIYDFGNDWVHKTLEEMDPGTIAIANCIAGKGIARRKIAEDPPNGWK
jgi:hypothetical protein